MPTAPDPADTEQNDPAQEAAGTGEQNPDPAAQPPADDSFESLSESWQREVKSLRNENAERRAKYNEVKALLDEAKSPEEFAKAVDEYRTQISELERKLSFQEHTHGLPEEALELVTGTTDEEIKASAERVRKLLDIAGKQERQERRDPDLEASGGTDPKSSRSTTAGLNPRELARNALQRR